jgi:hypothetical protein
LTLLSLYRIEEDHSFFQLAGVTKGGHEMGVVGYISMCSEKRKKITEPAEQRGKNLLPEEEEGGRT